ncbi:hypothetical protein KJ359_008143 [Pestalotiopsis sp. 9143b]|nr:hypothetical protein KJ359_008143 [Pestalotiopsis sp. 9143b]
MSSDDKNNRKGTPTAGAAGVVPTGHGAYMINPPGGYIGNGHMQQHPSYLDAGVAPGMAGIADQMGSLSLGSGPPTVQGVPLVQSNGGFYYSPHVLGLPVSVGGQLMADAQGMFWVQDGQKWALTRAPHPYDTTGISQQLPQFSEQHRQELSNYYDHLQRQQSRFGGQVPSLENRRSSYSTNESAPATPFYAAGRDVDAQVGIYSHGSAYNTPSPPQAGPNFIPTDKGGFTSVPVLNSGPTDDNMKQVIEQEPSIPLAVPAVFTPRESMKTVEQSLANNIPGNRNVYIRGLHPTTDDELLLKYAERFGPVETSKAIIDTTTSACKGFGFAKFKSMKDAEACIRGFHSMGYEVGFARVSSQPVTNTVQLYEERTQAVLRLREEVAAHPASVGDASAYQGDGHPIVVKKCDCKCDLHTDMFTNFNAWDQESFNSRLKAEGDENNTNLYFSNLPKSISESDLATIFDQYHIMSSKILRDQLGNSRGVGFARFESRAICDEIILLFTGIAVGDEGLQMQIRYSDTPAQKELKRVTTERRQFRTNEYNVGAYGTSHLSLPPTGIYGRTHNSGAVPQGHNGPHRGSGPDNGNGPHNGNGTHMTSSSGHPLGGKKTTGNTKYATPLPDWRRGPPN